MKKQIHILILSLISTFAFGQTEKESFWNPYIESDRIEIGLKHYDSLNFEKAYRIWTDYQVVELIKITDSTYNGTLTNFVTENKRKNKSEIIYQNIKIPNRIVEKLINSLNAENIETLKDCAEIENYPKGFDGKTYVFEIGNGNWFPNFNDEEIGAVRNKGYTFSINVDNKTYLGIGYGYSVTGDNSTSISLANEIFRWIGRNIELFEKDKTEFKKEIPGIIHGLSNTGNTVFLEPSEIIDMNNSLSILRNEEKKEIYRILAEITEEIGLEAENLSETNELVTRIDLINAKAMYARKYDGQKPIITDSNEIANESPNRDRFLMLLPES